MSGDDWDAIAEQGYGSWTRRDLAGLLDVLDPDVVFRSTGAFPGVEPEYRGHEGMRRFWSVLQEPWESFEMEVVRLEPHGDRAVVDLRFHAVGEGSGVLVELDIFHAVRRRGDKVVELSAHTTREEALEALGLS
jgi:ketosteroid isomerase-like protein